MKLNRVVLTENEAEWIKRNVAKTLSIMEAASKKDPQILERVTYKTLKALLPKTTEMALELMLSRKQKQIVATMVQQTLMVMEEKIIPEYQRRDLTEYLDDAKIKAGILKSMYRKLQ